MHRLIVLLCTFSLLFPLSGRARRDTQVEFVTSAGNFTVRLLRDTPVHSRHFEQLACSWEKPIAKKPSHPKSISPITTTAAGHWPWRASRTR